MKIRCIKNRLLGYDFDIELAPAGWSKQRLNYVECLHYGFTDDEIAKARDSSNTWIVRKRKDAQPPAESEVTT